MEVDTGASASIISNKTYTQLWPDSERPPLSPSNRKLHTYTKELTVLETLHPNITYGSQTATLPLLVIGGDAPSLLGRDWLMELRLDWQSIGLYCTEAAPPTTLQKVL